MKIRPSIALGCGLALAIAGVVLFSSLVTHRQTNLATPPDEFQAEDFRRLLPRRPKPGKSPRAVAKGAAKPQAGVERQRFPLLQRLLAGEDVTLTREQVETYLRQTGRTAASLLMAFRACNDKAFLEEAARRFPDDPKVQYAALMADAFPEDRSRWLEAFKQSAPENALANYLAARDHLKAGQPQQAMEELVQATLKPGVKDYGLESVQAHEDALVTSGYSPAEAKVVAAFGLALPQLSQLRDLSKQMAELVSQYRQSGDATAANTMISMGLTMGRQIGGDAPGKTFVEELVGIAIQKTFLQSLDPNAAIPGFTQTAGSRLAELDAKRNEIKDFSQMLDPNSMTTMSEGELSEYVDRMKAFGERNALIWLRDSRGRR